MGIGNEDVKNEAQAAIFAAVTAELGKIPAANLSASNRASVVLDLALAYRYAAGGQQPGSVTVEK